MQAELIGELYTELLNFSVYIVKVLPKRLWFATKIHLNLPEDKFLFLHLTQAAVNLEQYFFFLLNIARQHSAQLNSPCRITCG